MAEKVSKKPVAEDLLTPDMLLLLECWTRDGYTNEEVADKIGVSVPTLWRWREKFPEIEKAMATGREVVDYKVENALLKSALGYTIEEVKVVVVPRPDGSGNMTIRKEKTVKEIAPNPTSIAIWLNNRKPDQWKKNRDNIFELADEASKITVNIVRAGSEEDPTVKTIKPVKAPTDAKTEW